MANLKAILSSCDIGIALHPLLPCLGIQACWYGDVVGGSPSSLLKPLLLGLNPWQTLLQGHGAAALLLSLLISNLRCP